MGMTSTLEISLCSLGLFLAMYVAFQGKSGRSAADFIVSAFLAGSFCLSQILPFIDTSMNLFTLIAGAVVIIGALVGGVVGTLFPKVSTGFALGVFTSLLFSLIIFGFRDWLTSFDEVITSSAVFLFGITGGILMSIYFEEICIPTRTALASSLAIMLCVDKFLSSAMFFAVSDVLRMDAKDRGCYAECHVPLLIMAWVIVAILIFAVQTYVTGSFNILLSKRGRKHYQAVPTRDNKCSTVQQRTFSYPDSLEYNFFNLDNLPQLLKGDAQTAISAVLKLSATFGFQVDSSRNQAEHFMMMLTNERKQNERNMARSAVSRLHDKLFRNYKKWCDRVGSPPVFSGNAEDNADKLHSCLIVDILLMLLIWGEGANLRHMPECLCFLFHKTMNEFLSLGSRSREPFYPGFYLDMVITPIYDVVAASLKSKGDHTQKKLYDDFNEFFWSPTCLQYTLRDLTPEALEGGAHGLGTGLGDSGIPIAKALQGATKTYLERRSWLHPILSFHRVLEWHIVTFYILATIAFSAHLIWTFPFTLQVGSFVFLIINVLSIIWACLEVWVVFPTSSMSGPSLFGYLLRLMAGYLILVYQLIYYHWSFRMDVAPAGTLRAHGNANFWWWQYIWISLFSLTLYFVESIICWFPSIVSNLMCWNNDFVQAVLNICYPLSQLYVGKKMNVLQPQVFGYILFWLTLIAFKLWFGYFYIINPVVSPTLELYDDYMNFVGVPFVKTAFLMFVWWFPHFLVYLIDMSIWYTIWAAFVGGFIALVDRHGAVRDAESFRTHFMRMPFAFCQKLMPNPVVGARDDRKASKISIVGLDDLSKKAVPEPPVKKQGPALPAKKKNFSSADLSAMSFEPSESENNDGSAETVDRVALNDALSVRTRRWVVFSKAWNEIITRLRDTDHISDSEHGILVFTSFEWLSKPVYLPLFQTAGIVETVLYNFKAAGQTYHNEQEPAKKILAYEGFRSSLDVTSAEAVHEAWELASWLMTRLVGSIHAQDFAQIGSVIGRWSTSEDILNHFNVDLLPAIHDNVANIVTTLKGALGKRKKSPVVTQEVLRQAQHEDKGKGSESTGEQPSKLNMKRSVSTSFLAALESDSSGDKSSKADAAPKKFQKLQPFRKATVLSDNVRDKVREDLRGLLNGIRSALRTKTGSISAEGQDLIDRLTFVMSMESGFLWNDVYASQQIDELAKDSRVTGVVNKLHGLQRLRVTQVEPASAEARRRLNFFVNSLFMDMPSSQSSLYSKDFTCMTPYYSEDILLTKGDLESKNSDGVSTLLYLQTLYKKDWNNFLERRGLNDEQNVWSSKHVMETRMWASLRAQTLFRTVEGMMYTEAAISLLAELEQLEASVVDVLKKLKFNYVVACQVYGQMKKNLEHKAEDIEFLLNRHPNLRVAYIDSVRVNREGDMAFYSVLIKGDAATKAKEVYRVKLPGNPVLGEGKPENQNHAVIFTRGRYLQAVDMNQDGYFEEALKMRNLLEEFDSGCAILGFREHIFTGSVSSVANYMALQETSFVTLGQRVLSNPLHIRQHYGHPDLFNKMFVMMEGGVSKASKGINLSEDVFAGFNATIRGHTVGFKEYVQVGKGRDVGLQQTYKFEAKLSQGNSEQSLSRDMYRINDRLDFFRLMSFYYGGIGHYMANTMVIFTLVAVVYCMTGQAVYDEEGVNGRPMKPEGLFQILLAGMGVLQTMPLIFVLVVEKGVFTALMDLGYMFLSGGPLYFIFHIQTKCYYFSQTMMAGGAMYRPTGRGFVTRHSPFDENFRFFAVTHIYLGFELMVLLILLAIYTTSKQYPGLTWSLWMTSISFIFSPFWFNPLSFEFNKVAEDYHIWMRWMTERGGTTEQSWEVWWREETGYFSDLSWSWKLVMFLTRCSVWIFIGYGLSGNRLLTDGDELERLDCICLLFATFLVGHWFISQLHNSCSYAVRRVSSFLLSTAVLAFGIYLYCQSRRYFVLTVSLYFFAAAFSMVLLLLGVRTVPAFLNKMHDYIVGHFLFTALFMLSLLQLGYLQTWLLYHNALSAGVAIEDVLKYARKSKERAVDETEASMVELRNQLADQQRTIRMLMEERGVRAEAVGSETKVLQEKASPVPKAVPVTEFEMAKRGLLAGYNISKPGYGSISAEAPDKAYTAPRSVLRNPSPSRPPIVTAGSAVGASPIVISGTEKHAGVAVKNASTTSSAAPFIFSAPTTFPVRDTKHPK